MSVTSFYNLDPEAVLSATEALGLRVTGEFYQLNSFENRVFCIKLENPHQFGGIAQEIIAKFYRPQRWSKEALLEEHHFTRELLEDGVPVVSPIELAGQSVFEFGGIYAAFFPKTPGRLMQETTLSDLRSIGRLLARLHNVGGRKVAKHRLNMDMTYYGGWDTLSALESWIAPEVRDRYLDAAETILEDYESKIERVDFLRIHGDCHRGNILHNGAQYFFIDFDDFVNGPSVQDFWMLVQEPSSEEAQTLLEGYTDLRYFDAYEWQIVRPLRGMRIIGYAGWIAARWQDPVFPKLFPQFETYQYWAEEVEALEKIAWSTGVPI